MREQNLFAAIFILHGQVHCAKIFQPRIIGPIMGPQAQNYLMVPKHLKPAAGCSDYE